MDPDSSVITPLITRLSSAVDVLPLPARCRDEGFLTFEVNLTFPVPGPGRIQFFPNPDATPIVLANCLTTPTSMVFDRRGDRVVLSELATGRLMTLDLQSSNSR